MESNYQNSKDYHRFLGVLYDTLYRAGVITKKPGTYRIKEDLVKLSKGKIVNNYLDKLERVQSKASMHGKLDLIKQLYYDRYLIKIEDVDDAYWHKLEASYLAEGHGHVNLASPESKRDKVFRDEHFHNIYQAQKDSLNAWLNYLMSPDSDYLPMWGKV